MAPSTKYTPIICVGIGLSGIGLGAQLKRKYGLNFADIHFYERNESHGGTWWVNQYPGAACDIPAFFYSFSFALNTKWSELLPSSKEIGRYVDGVVKRYHLASHMTFRTICESASWDSERQRWTVHLTDLTTGEKYVHECTLLFSAVGQLSEPKMPEIKGMDTFEGPAFHTAQWRPDVDLKGKNTIVIGNGCSGSQVVPRIASQTKTLTQFIHSPHWLIPFPNPKFGPAAQWFFGHVPLLARLMRFMLFVYMENHWRMFIMSKAGARRRHAMEKSSKQYILSTAPKRFHDILIPDFEIGCRRRIFDTNHQYLESLHTPNLELVKDDIVEVLPRTVRTASKTYPADVIVLATGFQTQNFLRTFKVQGRNGEWLHDYWRNTGGPNAYQTTAVHGFPNFFILYGPNASTGHSSVLMTTENTINFVLKIIAPVLNGAASEVEVKAGAVRQYVADIQEASKTRVFTSGCNNWYLSKQGWNSTIYPWSQIQYWRRSIFPIWNDWEYKYTPRRAAIRRAEVFRTVVTVLCTLSLVGTVIVATLNRAFLARLASRYVHTWRGVLGV